MAETESAAKKDNGYTKCGDCCLWIAQPEDSTGVEHGRCPLKRLHESLTHVDDGCLYGILSNDSPLKTGVMA